MVAGQAEGHAIETVEGLAKGSRLSVLQEAMIEAGVVQSGYNTPAAALLLEDLLRRREEPTEDEVRDALSGLFSRATGYKQFFLAVRMACTRRSGGVWSAPVAPAFGDGLHVIGKSARKIDGGKLAAGMKAYVEDRAETGSCVLLMLRSPHAHAFIRSIDTARAQALPGVVLVIDHRTCPDVAYGQAGQGFPEPSPYDYRMFSRTAGTWETGWRLLSQRTRQRRGAPSGSSRRTMMSCRRFSPWTKQWPAASHQCTRTISATSSTSCPSGPTRAGTSRPAPRRHGECDEGFPDGGGRG